MRRDFISNLSHELRTPVSVIRANSETLLDGALDNKKEAKTFARAILHNSERLSVMVADLIDLSRIEYGDLKLNIKKIDLISFMDDFVTSMKSVTKKKEIEIILYLNNTKIKHNVADLQKNIWGYAANMETHTVETHIYRLRKKISDLFKDEKFILSHKNGYFID